jgi:hypothetical protein
MSSVGYGNVSPQTWEGKVVCICYATIGIPIFGISLINLSDFFGAIFKFVYAKINKINPVHKYLNYLRKRKKEYIMQKKLKKKLKQLKKTLMHNNDDTDELNSNSKNSIEEFHVELANHLNDKMEDDCKDLQILSISYDSSNSETELEDEDEDSNEIPMSVTILFFVFYTLIGSYIFMQFEDWSFVQSIYFVYVTLSTMGIFQLHKKFIIIYLIFIFVCMHA